MARQSKTATATTAYGKTLNPPITYTFEWDTFETIQEVEAARKLLTDDEVIKFRNDQAENKARGVALLEAYDAAGIVKPTAENDAQVRLKDMTKTLLTAKNKDGSAKYTEAEARAKAAELVGEDWE